MKRILVVLILLLISSTPVFAFGKMSEQDIYMMEVYGMSKRQVKKLNRIERRSNIRLRKTLAKVRRMRWNIDIGHDVINAYSQKKLAKIKLSYDKKIDKILTMEQKEGYKEYISKAY